jgi:2-oxoglutarate dehydrogenase E1 component
MTPKSLLRLPASFSPLGEFTNGGFRKTIDEGSSAPSDRLLLCSGKIYYDLKTAQAVTKDGERIRIVRIEQLYPFPADEVGAILKSHGSENEIYWVQEESKNWGAWTHIRGIFDEDFPETRIGYIGRKPSASPAAGTMKQHREEQEAIILQAMKVIATQEARR